ncbi:MAG TPA: MauE/DoxX family redox-associated membrane protein [Acidimicrobiales bacterium]|nr:MauE/DoxX family redox-associated membrane protein [Acidimicrobiales bacterium]
MTLVGLYLVGCALLVVAGTSKAIRPQTTTKALALLLPRLGDPWAQPAVRGVAAAEAALGAAGALLPERVPAALVAASFAAFAAFVLYVRRHGGVLASCGCFSTPDTPPTRSHVVIDLGLAACAATVSADGSTQSLGAYLARQPLDGVPLVASCALCAWAVVLVLVDLPRLARRREALDPNP